MFDSFDFDASKQLNWMNMNMDEQVLWFWLCQWVHVALLAVAKCQSVTSVSPKQCRCEPGTPHVVVRTTGQTVWGGSKVTGDKRLVVLVVFSTEMDDHGGGGGGGKPDRRHSWRASAVLTVIQESRHTAAENQR